MTIQTLKPLCKCTLCASVLEKKFMKTPKRKGYENENFCPECYDQYKEFYGKGY